VTVADEKRVERLPGHPVERRPGRELHVGLGHRTESVRSSTEANQISDNFVVAAVLFASVLFFLGLSGTFN
jgi:hypothetical protein